MALLAGLMVRPGPEGSGELVTPTGAALIRVLSDGPPPASYRPIRTGYGAGTKEFKDRANALRVTLAEVDDSESGTERLTMLACDIDDMTGEYLAALADDLRDAGALDVVLIPTIMKKGRPGTRIEVLASRAGAADLERHLLTFSSTIGVRRTEVERRALPREVKTVTVEGQQIRVKVVTLPDGTTRAKPEFDDVRKAAERLGKPAATILESVARAAEL
jgi:uncharacterized protein (DUF111 family)